MSQKVAVSTAQDLSPQQLSAIALLLIGHTDTAVAAELNIDRNTVGRWKKNDHVFIAELNLRKIEAWRASQEQLLAARQRAVETVLELLDCEDDGLRLRAAGLILKLEIVQPTGPTTAEEIEARAIARAEREKRTAPARRLLEGYLNGTR